MSVYNLHFYGNDSAVYVHTGLGATGTCPNGIMARLSGELPSEIRKTFSVQNGGTVIFQKVEDSVVDGSMDLGQVTIKMLFGIKNTRMVVHENCYEDFYRHNGNTKTVDTFVPDVTGDYVYDRDSASFIDRDPVEHASARRYSCIEKEINIQDKGVSIDAHVTTGDIVFADYAVTDRPIDIYINTGISVAGLKLTWASDTNVLEQENNVAFNLGNSELTGSFDNDVVRYAGHRFVQSIKLQPESRNAFAVRYKISADFVNNGYDDIEIHDLNLLTEQILGEIGGDNA